MPKRAATSRTASSTPSRRRGKRAPDAIQLLRADHRKVQDLFDAFDKSRTADRKAARALPPRPAASGGFGPLCDLSVRVPSF